MCLRSNSSSRTLLLCGCRWNNRRVLDAELNIKQTLITHQCFCSPQFNVEHRQQEMEEQKREKLQQLIRKNKDEQSEYGALFSRARFVCLRFQKDR